MSARKCRIALTRDELEALQFWLAVAQRDDVRMVRSEGLPPASADAARTRLEQMPGVNAAVYGARFPLTRAERARWRAQVAAALPRPSDSEDSRCTP